jgi:hypothetical protein
MKIKCVAHYVFCKVYDILMYLDTVETHSYL